MAKVNVGDKIYITGAQMSMGRYHNGNIFTVKSVDGHGVKVHEHGVYIFFEEFEVLEGTLTLKSATIDQLMTELSNRIKGLAPAEGVPEEPKPEPIPTPMSTRESIVQDAIADVREIERRGPRTAFNGGTAGNSTYQDKYYNVQFITNREKRTVVALVRLGATMNVNKAVVHRGVAKCDPSDCFNEHIGKAIAVRRAFELDVPSEYLHARAPKKGAEVGDLVEYKGKVFTIIPKTECTFGAYKAHPRSTVGTHGTIVDDTGRY